MTCIHCHKAIERCQHCPETPHYVSAETFESYCEFSGNGDHEPEPEDKQ